MLYLNKEEFILNFDEFNLTLTSVVFELLLAPFKPCSKKNLTLTSVVFECAITAGIGLGAII